MAGGPSAGRSWQCTHTNRFGVFPRVCLHVVCACVPSLLAVFYVLWGRVNRQPERQRSANLRAIVLQTANANTNPGTERRNRRRSPRPLRDPRDGLRGPVAGWRGALGSVPRGGNQRLRFSQGWGRGEWERKKENPPSSALSPLYACLCSVSSSAGRPCSPKDGLGDWRAERCGGGGSVQTIYLLLVPGKDDFQKCELCV